MFTTIAKLFGRSPFFPLQSHMKKVSSCIQKLTEIVQALQVKPFQELIELVNELSLLEHEADLTKNDIRRHLPKSLFLPIDRGQFLELLKIQDNLADQAEQIGHLLTLCPMSCFGRLCLHFTELFHVNVQGFWDVRNIIKAFDGLLESAFGGVEAEKVKAIIEHTSQVEYEADKMKHQLMKQFFSSISEEEFTPVFYLYIRLVEEINKVSHISEKLANRIFMILELR